MRIRGPIAWMANNPVAANLLMLTCLVGGLIVFFQVTQEVFPYAEEDIVTVSVRYPGATPAEVEQGICLAVEEAVRGIEGVKEVIATANEGSASISAEILDGSDRMKVYQDIKSEIDRITTFPLDAEEPQVSLQVRRRGTMDLVLTGDIPEVSLRMLAEQVRDRLLQNPYITQIDLAGTRNFEISIEVSQENLRRYGLTHRSIASQLSNEAVELSGGGIKTDSGETLLRMKERKNFGYEFEQVPVVTSEDGTRILLGEIATVIDGFEDSDRFAYYNGRRAVMLEVYRVGDQTPAQISGAVAEMLPQIRAELPDGVEIAVLNDRTKMFFQRAALLLNNGYMGLLLVVLFLGIFLEIRIAFWVMMAIPVSFLGSVILMPLCDLSINMTTMFAFILALGMVVDNAIVVGENYYYYQQNGMPPVDAAVKGTREVATPVAYSILTNIVAFMPLLVLPGMMRRNMGPLPLIVIFVFIFSWIECIFILPAHLSHGRLRGEKRGLNAWIHRKQQKFSGWFERWVKNKYGPFLNFCLKHRYLVVAFSVMLLLTVSGYWASGRLGYQLFATIESDFAQVSLVMPYGTPVEKTAAIAQRIVRAAQELVEESGHPELCEGIFSDVGRGGSHQVNVRAYLADAEVRDKIMSTTEFAACWRAKVGPIPGMRSARFSADSGGGPGAGYALTVELRHEDVDTLETAAQELAVELGEFPRVTDIDDGVLQGKPQFDFTMRAEAASLGLTAEDVGRQIRSAFEGTEVLRQQRGRNEVKVKVRYPAEERRRMYNLENFILRTPDGGEVPLLEVVDIEKGYSYTSIRRRDGLRTQTIRADVRPRSRTGEVMALLDNTALPKLMRNYPGLSYSYEGLQKESRDSLASLRVTLPLVLIAIYALLAIPFKSYSQPLIVMVSIPFGAIGAVLGHVIMGYSMTMNGLVGMLALAGVVVNGALVLIDFANARRKTHDNAHDAVVSAGIQRFRPIMLTTLTTFAGLAPMIFETSRQARYLIPMAISLGFGLLFSTTITLVLVPALYMITEDIKHGIHNFFHHQHEN
ncbi:MAG: efflux RND transporter permease subunit [Kiritimatiellales bacterium]